MGEDIRINESFVNSSMEYIYIYVCVYIYTYIYMGLFQIYDWTMSCPMGEHITYVAFSPTWNSRIIPPSMFNIAENGRSCIQMLHKIWHAEMKEF